MAWFQNAQTPNEMQNHTIETTLDAVTMTSIVSNRSSGSGYDAQSQPIQSSAMQQHLGVQGSETRSSGALAVPHGTRHVHVDSTAHTPTPRNTPVSYFDDFTWCVRQERTDDQHEMIERWKVCGFGDGSAAPGDEGEVVLLNVHKHKFNVVIGVSSKTKTTRAVEQSAGPNVDDVTCEYEAQPLTLTASEACNEGFKGHSLRLNILARRHAQEAFSSLEDPTEVSRADLQTTLLQAREEIVDNVFPGSSCKIDDGRLKYHMAGCVSLDDLRRLTRATRREIPKTNLEQHLTLDHS